jgi:hypothetical protein
MLTQSSGDMQRECDVRFGQKRTLFLYVICPVESTQNVLATRPVL